MNQQPNSNVMHFIGQGREFFDIWIVNVLLSVITLGIFTPWAKVRQKRYFYNNTFLYSDNFEYHANPKKMLAVRLSVIVFMVMATYITSIYIRNYLVGPLIFIAILPGLILYKTKFDAEMTSYRDIRFSFTGTLEGLFKVLIGRALVMFSSIVGFVIVFTWVRYDQSLDAFGINLLAFSIMFSSYGWFISGLYKYFANGYQYGNKKFTADIKERYFNELYFKVCLVTAPVFFALIFFGLIPLGLFFFGLNAFLPQLMWDYYPYELLMSYYYDGFMPNFVEIITFPIVFLIMFIGITSYTTVVIRNYVFSQLQLEVSEQDGPSFEFTSTLTFKELLSLTIYNFALQVFTLGLGRPWAMINTVRYMTKNTAVIGDISKIDKLD